MHPSYLFNHFFMGYLKLFDIIFIICVYSFHRTWTCIKSEIKLDNKIAIEFKYSKKKYISLKVGNNN